ncbi:MAG TPA: LanC-like protein [Casimicrobiaceae bacterium]|nr:LanC-like protein [Casimicrobiaceae bacterium]
MPALYYGACGVVWALGYPDAVGAAPAHRDFAPHLEPIRASIAAWLSPEIDGVASYLMGETPLLMLRYGWTRDAVDGDRLEALIAHNADHPAREMMWGAPGTMLAALFLHRLTGESRWADLFRASARALWSHLTWSPEFRCRYWAQDLYGEQRSFIDAVHGFVGTASPLVMGRGLLEGDVWEAWRACIVETVSLTATREGPLANWRAQLYGPERMLMQYCHGAPGFVVCLADMPGPELDALLIAGGEATWAAGPLRKGANLCHGTGGNGYAFLKLFERTRDATWLTRARAFAMHALVQMEADEARYGGLRHSLWTGDEGFAIYLWDCIRGAAAFPTVDVFYAA